MKSYEIYKSKIVSVWRVANIVAIPIFVNLNIPRYITLYIVCKSKWAYQ